LVGHKLKDYDSKWSSVADGSSKQGHKIFSG
jgi:hypothetical protein